MKYVEETEKIINYLILEELKNRNPNEDPNITMRAAFLKARKKYEKMSKKEKEDIFKKKLE